MMALRATLALTGDNLPSVGRERILLLEAVAREGSISAAARSAGITYKAAWDALDAMANVFGRPLLQARAGGRAGGGAALTPAGHAVIEAYRKLEAELGRVMKAIEPALAGTGLPAEGFLAGALLRTSARNVLRGRIVAVSPEGIHVDVTVAVSGSVVLHALITRASLGALGLAPGRDVVVLVKAPSVMIAAPGPGLRLSARNQVPGTVLRCESDGVAAEIVLDIGEGRTLAASVTAEAVESLGLAEGSAATAVFDASHCLLAID